MTLKERLTADMKAAMLAKDAETRDTLRLINAAIKQVEVDDQVTLDDSGVESVLQKQAKQRRDSIAEYEKAGRDDLAATEKTELAIIEKYLPQMMSREEIEVLAASVIQDVNASGPQAMGAVMGKLMPQVKGKADGRLVNQVVRDLLSS